MSHPVQRLKFQWIRRALAFKDDDCSLGGELIVGELEVPTCAVKFTEGIGQLLVPRSSVSTAVDCSALGSPTAAVSGVAIEVLSCGVPLHVEMVE